MKCFSSDFQGPKSAPPGVTWPSPCSVSIAMVPKKIKQRATTTKPLPFSVKMEVPILEIVTAENFQLEIYPKVLYIVCCMKLFREHLMHGNVGVPMTWNDVKDHENELCIIPH